MHTKGPDASERERRHSTFVVICVSKLIETHIVHLIATFQFCISESPECFLQMHKTY